MRQLSFPRRLTRRSGVVILVALLLVTATGIVIAQQSVGQFEAVTLQHVSPQEAAQKLSATFGGSVEVIPDPAKNRVLISTSRESRPAVQQFLARIDQPARPFVQASQETNANTRSQERTVIAYRVHERDLEPLASLLRSSYAADSGLMVATDERIGQLLVVANEAIQNEIMRFMRSKGYSPHEDGQPQVNQDDANNLNSVVNRVHELRNITWREFEAAIVRTWGNRLRVTSQRNGELMRVELPAPEGVSAVMNIDRLAGVVQFEGPATIVEAWQKAVSALDIPAKEMSEDTRWIATENADVNEIRKAVSYLRLSSANEVNEGEVAALVPLAPNGLRNGGFQDNGGAQDNGAGGLQDPNVEPQDPNEDPNQLGDDQTEGLIGPVQLEFIEELGIIVVTGNPADVEKVNRIINQIIDISQETLPRVELYPLANVDSQAISEVVQELYDQVFAPRQDPVTITALNKPNALLLVGRDEAVESVLAFLRELDVPVPPANEFEVIYLKHMSAIDAKARLDEHYLGISTTNQAGANQVQTDIGTALSVRVRATADYRSNALVISASPRDIEEIKAFVSSIDVVSPESSNTVRILRLKNALAEELAPVLQDVLNGQLQGAGLGYNPQGNQGNLQQLQGGFGAQQQQLARVRSVMLELVTIDPAGQQLITKSGITFDVRVTADTNSNSLIVQGPAENMDLIAKLVQELDRLPDAETLLKVYTIVNGDAAKLLELLQALFGSDETLPLQSGTQGDSSTLVSLRFAIDTRTNSLIVSGSDADLLVVESLLIRLDLEDFEDRVTLVTRLHNASAADVATAVNDWLDGRDDLNSNEDLFSIYQQNERAIIVVPEPASNSLIISATEEFMPEVEAVIETLDRRPPMVMIQVLIASVVLGDIEEFGFEAGLQDSLLFDRGASNIGFNFNQSLIGNDPASYATTRETLLSQALSNLNIGRTNSTLGFGGLVLSASNESVTLLLRALKQRNRLQVLSRPQIMTVENLQGFVQIGQRVPYITETTLSNFGQTNTTTFVDVGILLQVTPRVSPDGMMVLAVDATKSELGPEAEGIPISINQNGDVIRSPAIDIITAQTTVMARTGQTVVMGGLIETSDQDIMRGVPIISDIPAVGALFRFESTEQQRSELLIIMTPYLVEDEDDITMLNQMEMDRMSWCLADVAEVHGHIGYADFDGNIHTPSPATVYPDLDPTGTQPQENLGPQLPVPPNQGGRSGFQDPSNINELRTPTIPSSFGGSNEYFPPINQSRQAPFGYGEQPRNTDPQGFQSSNGYRNGAPSNVRGPAQPQGGQNNYPASYLSDAERSRQLLDSYRNANNNAYQQQPRDRVVRNPDPRSSNFRDEYFNASGSRNSDPRQQGYSNQQDQRRFDDAGQPASISANLRYRNDFQGTNQNYRR